MARSTNQMQGLKAVEVGEVSPATLDHQRLATTPRVALLTAGRDRPYALGLAECLLARNIAFDFIASDGLDAPFLHRSPGVTFLNLRGDSRDGVSLAAKIVRILSYYWRLLKYAVQARPRIFHILWNNKVEWFDRTLLMLFYKLCGRKIVLTAHNINSAVRDGHDSVMNRLTLRAQYRLADHIFVHTRDMLRTLQGEYGVRDEQASVIPFGTNNTVPDTQMDGAEARSRLGVGDEERVVLFFGNIAPYKGLEYLIQAMAQLTVAQFKCRVVIAGRPKGGDDYWSDIKRMIAEEGLAEQVIARSEFIPDEETEIYFKAADVLVLPYRHIFQSGVLFLGYNFGLPVIAADVGSLKEDIAEGHTGYMCRPEDSSSLAKVIQKYFDSDLYRNLPTRRSEIRAFASERYSWSRIGEVTERVYAEVGG